MRSLGTAQEILLLFIASGVNGDALEIPNGIFRLRN